nr:hypothetical protein [Candidatus Sigynarchaeota archaeon]
MHAFFELLGGFLVYPSLQSKKFMELPLSRKDFLRLNLLVQFLSAMLGVVVMFMLFYPDLQMYTEAVHDGLNLFIIPLGNPVLLLIAFAGGYLVLFIINFTCIGSINYWISRRLLSHDTEGRRFSYKNFMAAHGFAQLPLGLFCVFNIFWIYFFERANIVKIFFPFVDLSEPVIVYFCVLAFFLAWKWHVQARVLESIGLGTAKRAFLIGLEILFLSCCIIFIAVIGNLAVAIFS